MSRKTARKQPTARDNSVHNPVAPGCYRDWANVVIKRILWSQLLQGLGERCYKRIQWSQLLQRLGECCYKRIQWLQLLQGVGENCYLDWTVDWTIDSQLFRL